MKFFTTPYGDWPYHLIPYKKWKKGYKKDYEYLIIDCGVNDLKGKKDYPLIDDYPLNTKDNIYWVIPDYPYDVKPNLTQNECIGMSWENILKWSHLPNTIASVQYSYENVRSFIENYERVYPLAHIIGIGNLCKSTNMKFLRKVIEYIVTHNPNNKWIHFFGLFKPAIQYLNTFNIDFEVSVDSMKWDYGLHGNRKIGTSGNLKVNRWKKFHDYIKNIDIKNKTKQRTLFEVVK